MIQASESIESAVYKVSKIYKKKCFLEGVNLAIHGLDVFHVVNVLLLDLIARLAHDV